MKTIHAIYENGVFRPVEDIDLPERCEVEFEPRIVTSEVSPPAVEEVYAILGKRFNSGERDVAERHNEHQP